MNEPESLSHTNVCPTPGVVHEPPIELHPSGLVTHPGGLHHKPSVTGADIQQGALVENCQARVQVPNPLSQQAPNPDPKVRPSLKNPKTQFFGLG